MDLEALKTEAALGSVVAQTVLGIIYLEGYEGLAVDLEKAFDLLTRASAAGAARARSNLGRMYEEGLATACDLDAARTLYEQAANAGEFMPMVYLARLYQNGKGVPQDFEKAEKWYRQAAEQRHRIADCPELREAVTYVDRHTPR